MTSGLLSSIRTVLASTCCPAWADTFSTRPGVSALIQRICSGTRVPGPRTSRVIGPLVTVSRQSAPPSAVGAAGLSRLRPRVASNTTPAPALQRIAGRRDFGLIRCISTPALDELDQEESVPYIRKKRADVDSGIPPL